MRNETASDVAAELNLDEKTVRRWAAANCPHERTKDGRLLFNIVEVRAWQVATGHTGAARRPTAAEEARRNAPPVPAATIFSLTPDALGAMMPAPFRAALDQLEDSQLAELCEGLQAVAGLWLAFAINPDADPERLAAANFWRAALDSLTSAKQAELATVLARASAAYFDKTFARSGWTSRLSKSDRAGLTALLAPKAKGGK